MNKYDRLTEKEKELLNKGIIPVTKDGSIDYREMWKDDINTKNFPFEDENAVYENRLNPKAAATVLAVSERRVDNITGSLNIVNNVDLLEDSTIFDELPEIGYMKSVWNDYEDGCLNVSKEGDKFADPMIDMCIKIYPLLSYIKDICIASITKANRNGFNMLLDGELLIDHKNEILCFIAPHCVAYGNRKRFDENIYIDDYLRCKREIVRLASKEEDKVKFYIDNYDLSHNVIYTNSKDEEETYREELVGSDINIKFNNIERDIAFSYNKYKNFGDSNPPGVIIAFFKISDLNNLVELEKTLGAKVEYIK